MDTTETIHQKAGDAVLEIATALKNNFGLPDLTAEMFSLAVICAAIGYSRGVVDPAGGILSPGLQIVAHGKAQVTLQHALRGAFNPISEVQGGSYRAAMVKGEDHARSRMMALQNEIRRCQSEIERVDEKLNPPLGHSSYQVDLDLMRTFNENANPSLVRRQKDLVEKVIKLQQQLRQLTIALNPVVLVESISPGEIRVFGQTSLDGVLFNLDPRGVSLNHLLAISPRHRREICQATALTMYHAAVRPRNPRHVPLANSGASILSKYLAGKFIRNREVKASGLLDHIIFLSLDEITQREGPAEMPGEDSAAGRLAKELMSLRAEDKSAVLELSASARGLYWSFCREIETMAVSEPDDFQCRLSLLPQLTLKLVLLYHIGIGGLDIPEISAATFAKAAALARVIYAHQKTALAINGEEANSDKCIDFQMLKLVVKIRGMDLPTRRDIARSCHDQNYERLNSLLLKAQADGFIRERDGHYEALKREGVAA